MHSVFIMAFKDLVLTTRNWLGLFFIVGFPVLMGIFFGSMYGGVGERGSAKLDVAVADEDGSPMSAKFIESIAGSGSVNVQKLPRDEALNRVRRGQLVGMIDIPSGFGKTAGMMWLQGPAIELSVDPSRHNIMQVLSWVRSVC
jgi:ABC-2 type transport system permease protein